MQTCKGGAEIREFRECQITLSQTHDSLSQQNQASAGLPWDLLAGGTLELLRKCSRNAPLSAWETGLFETHPGFQLPGPCAPSAKHQERGRCWKHICQPALIVSGTSLSPSEMLSPILKGATLTGFNNSCPSPATGGHPGAPLEAAAPEPGPPL